MYVVKNNEPYGFFKKIKVFSICLLSSSLILNSSQPGESRPHHSRGSLDFAKKKSALHSKKVALKKALAIRKEQIHAKRHAYHKNRQAKRKYAIKKRAGHRRPARITLTQQVAQLQVQLQQARLQLQEFFVEIRQEIRHSQDQSPIRPLIVLQGPPTPLRTSPMTETTLRSHAAPTTRLTLAPRRAFPETTALTTIETSTTTTPPTEAPQVTITIPPEETSFLTTLPRRSYMDEIINFSRDRLRSHTSPATSTTLAPTRTFTETTAPTTTMPVAPTTPVPITLTAAPTTIETLTTTTPTTGVPQVTTTMPILDESAPMIRAVNWPAPPRRRTVPTTESTSTTAITPSAPTTASTTIETSTMTIPRADVQQIEETTTTPISTTPTTDQRANLLQSLQQGFSPSPDGTMTFRGLRPAGNRRLREEPLQPQQENTMDAMISFARASTQSVGEDRREEEESWSLQSSLIISTEELALPTIEILPETPLISNRPRVTNDNSFNIDAEDRRSIEPIIQASEGWGRGDETRTDMWQDLRENLDRNIRPSLTDSVASPENLTWSMVGREEEAQNENLANRPIPLVRPNLRSSLGSEEEELLDPQI